MKRPEQELQITLVDWLDLAIDPKSGWRWHTPNEGQQGGKRGAIIGRIRKQMGLVAGFPDLCLTHQDLICEACGVARPIGLEVKAGSAQTASQKACEERFKSFGWPYYIVRSLDDLRDVLKEEGIPSRVVELPFRGQIS